MRVVAACSLALWIVLASTGRGEESSAVAREAVAPSPVVPSPVAPVPPGACRSESSPPLPVATVETKPAGNDELLTRKLAELERLQAEIDALRQATGRDQQIRVDVKIIEVSLTKMRQSGLDPSQFGVDPSDRDGSSTASTDSAKNKASAVIGSRIANRESVAGAIHTLRQQNILKTLAEPSLVTSDGRPASFFSGGEFPVPMTRADGSKGFTGRKIGTQVDLTATLLGGHRIHLDIRASASEVDPASSLTIAGEKVPGFRTREMDIPVEMELGKTAVLGGLVPQAMQVVVDPKTRRRSSVPEQTQLLFLVTPELFAAAE